MNDFAKFDKIPSMTLQDIKETKRYGHSFVRTAGQRENSIPSHKHSLQGGGGYKDTDQLHGNRTADQCLCFYIDCTILLLLKSEISNHLPFLWLHSPVCVRTWSETPKTGFLMT